MFYYILIHTIHYTMFHIYSLTCYYLYFGGAVIAQKSAETNYSVHKEHVALWVTQINHKIIEALNQGGGAGAGKYWNCKKYEVSDNLFLHCLTVICANFVWFINELRGCCLALSLCMTSGKSSVRGGVPSRLVFIGYIGRQTFSWDVFPEPYLLIYCEETTFHFLVCVLSFIFIKYTSNLYVSWLLLFAVLFSLFFFFILFRAHSGIYNCD